MTADNAVKHFAPGITEGSCSQALPGNILQMRLCLVLRRRSLQSTGFPSRAWGPNSQNGVGPWDYWGQSGFSTDVTSSGVIVLLGRQLASAIAALSNRSRRPVGSLLAVR